MLQWANTWWNSRTTQGWKNRRRWCNKRKYTGYRNNIKQLLIWETRSSAHTACSYSTLSSEESLWLDILLARFPNPLFFPKMQFACMLIRIFFSLRFCSLKVDIFESFVSSKVNMTIKDLWCKKQQPQIRSFHLFHSDGTIKPMTLGQDAPGQMHRSSLLPYTPHDTSTDHTVGLRMLTAQVRRTCNWLVSLAHSSFDF